MGECTSGRGVALVKKKFIVNHHNYKKESLN